MKMFYPDFEMVLFAPVVTGITLFFLIPCALNFKVFNFKVFWLLS